MPCPGDSAVGQEGQMKRVSLVAVGQATGVFLIIS
jgi:hypothetical protein